MSAQNPVKVPGREHNKQPRPGANDNRGTKIVRRGKTQPPATDNQNHIDYKKLDYDYLMASIPATPKGKFDRAMALSGYMNNNSFDYSTKGLEERIWQLLIDAAAGGYGDAIMVAAMSELHPDVHYSSKYYTGHLQKIHSKGYKSIDDIMEQLNRAATLGSDEAMIMISHELFWKKPGDAKQYSEAFDWLIKAADANNVAAQMEVVNYKSGINYPYNTNFTVDVEYWKRRLASNPDAYKDPYYMSKLCEKKYGYHIDMAYTNSIDKIIFYDGTSQHTKCDHVSLGMQFRNDLERGDQETIALAAYYFDCSRYSYRYSNDNMAYSTGLWKRLADMGHNIGRFIYSQRLREGLGCKRDEAASRKLMEAIIGDSACDINLIRMAREELASW